MTKEWNIWEFQEDWQMHYLMEDDFKEDLRMDGRMQ